MEPRANNGPARNYPAQFGLALDPATRRPSRNTLVGGSPLRVIRLSDGGAHRLEAWMAGGAVGPDPAARRLARRLVDSAAAHPRPPAGAGPATRDLTVVVPVRDRPSGLQDTLSSLGDLDVVVVDDASVEPLRLDAQRVIHRAGSGGPATARNTGWRCVESPIIVFLDADCVPEVGWLSRILPHFADPVVGAVAPRVRSAAGSGLLARYEAVMSPLDLGPTEAAVRPGSRVPYVPTACLAVRRCALEACGGFDEQLRFGEDVDLVWRLVEAGWSVRYEPEAVVVHPPRPDALAWVRQRFDYGRSAAPLSARHGSDVAPAALSPWSAAVWGLAGAGQARAGAALAGLLSALLAVRAGRDAPTRRVLAVLAAKGQLVACKSIATAIRRAWTPPLVLALLSPSRRLRRRAAVWLAVGFLWPLADWAALSAKEQRPVMGPISWTALRWMDDLSYQSGLWAGAMEHRSPGALLVRWIRRPRPSTRARDQAAATDSSSAMPISR